MVPMCTETCWVCKWTSFTNVYKESARVGLLFYNFSNYVLSMNNTKFHGIKLADSFGFQ
jgi:hypothetical protein